MFVASFPVVQYLGDTTSPLVKDRIKELLFGWKVGLAHEGKINEAFLMLKREGTAGGVLFSPLPNLFSRPYI